MSLDLANYEVQAREAVKLFWGNREAALAKQIESGNQDAGARGAVTAGKNMDGFLAIAQTLIEANGLGLADICVKQRVLTLPGFFRPTKERSTRVAKEEVIGQIIAEYRERLQGLVGDEDDRGELEDQVARLDRTLEGEAATLKQSEEQFRALSNQRSELRLNREAVRERRSEISELLARFALLDAHYSSDLQRLAGLREAERSTRAEKSLGHALRRGCAGGHTPRSVGQVNA